ncbi:MAG: endonuclease [Candidatus Sericytochromatia bacterium]|nr:endonuclease [Candidatus Sericytochromatia bacterium]
MRQSRFVLNLLLAGAVLASVSACGTQPTLRPAVASSALMARKIKVRGLPADYYKGTEGLAGPALVQALNGVVAKHTDLGYDTARDHLFGDVADTDDDDIVEDIYTGEAFTGVRDRGTASKHNLNTEHTWPQSLGAKGAARSDLHHLQSSDAGINGSRGSFAFGTVAGSPTFQFPAVDGKTRIGEDARGNTVCEPRPGVRGDIARGLLYFYVVYGGYDSTSLKNFVNEVRTLVAWHDMDPVDAAERERNERVWQVQGNRNPFIDEPTFVARAAFDRMDLSRPNRPSRPR